MHCPPTIKSFASRGTEKVFHEIGVSPTRISHIVKGTRPVTADIALRLGRHFGQSAQCWLNLQARYDLDCALDEMGKEALTTIQPIAA